MGNAMKVIELVKSVKASWDEAVRLNQRDCAMEDGQKSTLITSPLTPNRARRTSGVSLRIFDQSCSLCPPTTQRNPEAGH
jgi:hypothetical protein